jgi:uncharacterized surface protein with fasciclin (FAS1) repeats
MVLAQQALIFPELPARNSYSLLEIIKLVQLCLPESRGWNNMRLSAPFVSAIVGAASGQSLQDVLAGNSNVSSLVSLLKSQPSLLTALGGASNITILAPSNNALGTVLNSTAGAALASDPGAVQALLQYHVLNGTYAASAITNTSQFIPSLLTNTSYTNVTGGQVVQALSVNGTATFFTGLLANSTVSQVSPIYRTDS